MICSELPVTAVIGVTHAYSVSPTVLHYRGLTSTGFVATNPLVRESPETPGGDDLV